MGSHSPEQAECLNVAIIGGGLCGLALAVALKQRNIGFKVYETRSSFTELGAGINIGPNTLEAFRLIDGGLGEAYLDMAARNPPDRQDVWFDVRLGAAIDSHRDGESVASLMAPPTGSMCVGRDALLQLLAERAGLIDGVGRQRAAFNKKLVGLENTVCGVTMSFEDGTFEQASVVIACDGIHSAVRRLMIDPDSLAATPGFSQAGGYRAMLPFQKLEMVLGPQMARTSQVFLGPSGYLIMYPVSETTMNVALWVWRRGTWPHREWVLPNQRSAMEQDLQGWGATVHSIMELAPDPPFFAGHYYRTQPESHWKGRVCLIGDAAHAMPPHAGSGAGQAMEDAYVMAEVLSSAAEFDPTEAHVAAALSAYEAVRRPRYERVVAASVKGMHDWSDLYDVPVTEERLADWIELAKSRFEFIWKHDLAGDASRARTSMRQKAVL
ncbi:hypothetical protein LTR27_003218 [Elasticomyces elasticus]|nr:hypothetical protein LTR27_003218 [Elasticomyces elasticus]